ncbi:MAG: ABC transporter ATP-binding protein [Lachnospiraceae bacterium]|nr:ABC transporter ATP-binding protein [Lachnospiraceae bacterium]MBP5183671.1 ABC transporter ATP-binding protein [Lachnospiraceae bacterium]
MPENKEAVRLRGISKTFGHVAANTNVNLSIRHGEILSLLGENGSGKTTLMNMLAGIYYPDEGEILIDDVPVQIKSPKDAFDNGIGMVHQHFKLIDVFTAAENIVLGENADRMKIDRKAVAAKIREICDKYGFDIDPDKKVYDMNVSQKQTLEIVKILYRGANILILDEPTAVLTPQESEKLFRVIRNMRDAGKAIVIITHKLQEVLSVSDRVAILRKGECVASIDTVNANEKILTEMMMGRKVDLNIERPEPVNPTKRLEIKNLTVRDREGNLALKDISFVANSGEILGIAGISGCGQKELLESVAGLAAVESGSIEYLPSDAVTPTELVGKNPKQIRELGVVLSFVPEDRLGMGLVGSMGMSENMMLKSYENGKTIFTEQKAPRELAGSIKDELEVQTPDIQTPVSRLSGGNVQKVLVGREIAAAPQVLMTAYAVRGLDINTSFTIYRLINEQKKKGVAVIFVGEDLDVLLALSDRILVLCEGRITGILDARTCTKEQVGLLMTGGTGVESNGAEQSK